MKKYFGINTITLAQSLNFLGFEYYIFDNDDGSKTYSFSNTKRFQEAYKELCNLRIKYKKQ